MAKRSVRQTISSIRSMRKTLGQAVAEQILNDIRSGHFRPGELLPSESQLTRMFDVSRSTVREAIGALVARGTVETRPGRGSMVLGISSAQLLDDETVAALLDEGTIDDLRELRSLIETRAAERAAIRATDEQIATVDAALETYMSCAKEGVEAYAADVAFHEAIAEASNNELIVKVLNAVTAYLSQVRKRTDQVPGAIKSAVRQHQDIAAAIRQRDPVLARQAMEDHLESATWAVEQLSVGEETDQSATQQEPETSKK